MIQFASIDADHAPTCDGLPGSWGKPCGEGSREVAPAGSPRTLLVGTALSVSQLHHCLAAADPRPAVIGCLLPDAAAKAEADNLEAWAACPILGRHADITEVAGRQDVEQVLLCLPVSLAELQRELAGQLEALGIRWRLMPTLADQLAGRLGPTPTRAWQAGLSFTSSATNGTAGPASSAATRAPTATNATSSAAAPAAPTLDLAALIDRQPRKLDEAAIHNFIADRTVLITGAGGSIGSQLARLVSLFKPGRLLLVERSENALFEIDREIGRIHPKLDKRAILHDITYRDATLTLLRRETPHIIFHAAAHKHVPMMEDHPFAAVENNFFGTRSIADAADTTGTSSFVMISTDKAVNPSSVMGASKRLAELYIQHLNTRSDCTFSMVRFGNVLGSACSVLPIWSGQLAHGGPITVTHPDMTRYFMTIPEAAGLVMQAAAISSQSGDGGEVFLLDMGRPVRIVDLARRFLLTQGFEPDVDIPIQFTGIRPGEKLFEELAYDGEDMLPTEHEAIRIWRTSPPGAAQIRQMIDTFQRLRDREGSGDNGWHHVPPQTITNALRLAIPEMVAAAAG